MPTSTTTVTAAQHADRPYSMLMNVPGLKICVPATPADAKGLLKAAIRDDNPVIYFEHKYLYRRGKGPVPQGDEIVPIGVATAAAVMALVVTVATPHALVLTVSHDWLVADSQFAAVVAPPICSIPVLHSQPATRDGPMTTIKPRAAQSPRSNLGAGTASPRPLPSAVSLGLRRSRR